MIVAVYKDHDGNTARIEKNYIMPYRGANSHVVAYRLIITSDYDGDYCYHVSVHESLNDAQDQLRKFSCGNWQGAVYRDLV